MINKATLTVTADNKTKVYDGAIFTYANYTASYSGFENGEGIGVLGGALEFSGTAMAATAVGNYVITPSGWTSSNYDIHYAAGELSITSVTVSLSVMLQGPYDTGTGFMNTDLSTGSLIPAAQPFNTAPWNYAGTETATPTATSVDWVLVEFRSDETTIVGRCAGLLNEDGIVTLSVAAPAIHAGDNYYVVVWHRNHIPVMSASALTMPLASYDFTSVANCYLSGAIKVKTGVAPNPDVYAMIAGEVVQNGNLKYSGPNNDRGPIIAKIVTVTGSNNINGVTPAGYWQEDAGVNSIVKYLGTENDRAVILSNLGMLTGNNYLNSVYTSVVPYNYTGGKSAAAGGYVDALFHESANNLTVDLTTKESVYEGVVDNIQFTLAWKADDTQIAQLLSNYTSGFNLLPQGNAVQVGGVSYQTFASVTSTNLPQSWNVGENVAVLSFAKEVGASIGDRLWIAENDYTTASNGDYFVSNLGNDVTGTIISTTTDIIDPIGVSSLLLYPNPLNAGSPLYLQIKTDRSENFEAEIWDMTGKLMKKDKIHTTPGTINYKVDVSSFAPGVYVINLHGGKVLYTNRFVIN